jgi:hypothetical protein
MLRLAGVVLGCGLCVRIARLWLRERRKVAVEGFRNVTFILQNEMSVIPGYNAWYEAWQARMRADPIMKWLHDSRTTVVHKGDLETHSTATVSICANWFGPLHMGTIEVPPLIPPR